ncbi:phosphotransferase [Streptomyces winkii]|uniref:phosphotransferase n=1 Tax=Streptomyces winkii TaxID=3051178 RepID=UPI0028D6824C|nr:phosphotransferase [Streptomyces sp. DSM 40971]
MPRPASVRALLADRWSAPVTVEGWERLEPWAVARLRLGGDAAHPTVIVKWTRSGRSRTRTDGWRLSTEVAALRFLSDDLRLGLGPAVVAEDLAAGYAVLEDLAPRVPLAGLLRRDGAAAHSGRLAAFARALGELGAATAGHVRTYDARRAGIAPARPGVERTADLGGLGGLRGGEFRPAPPPVPPVGGRAAAELSSVIDELTEPGPFLSLSNGDPEANNVLVHESGPADARLIDFESAAYGHALTDAVCLHVPGPAWMSVGDPADAGLDVHYRTALARGIPEAEDDRRYGFGLAAACMSWALLRLRRFSLLDARTPGDDSRAQLVGTLESAARTAEFHRALPHLAGWVRRAAGVLRRRWPDADRELTGSAGVPPYTPRR